MAAGPGGTRAADPTGSSAPIRAVRDDGPGCRTVSRRECRHAHVSRAHGEGTATNGVRIPLVAERPAAARDAAGAAAAPVHAGPPQIQRVDVAVRHLR